MGTGRGFGTLLVDTSARQLGARLERQVDADRFRLTLRLPRDVLVHG